MPYVVMVTSRMGTIWWLSAASEAGFRTLETRERADVFPTVKDAHDAIDKLPQAFGEAGLIFSVRDGRPISPIE
jgi:hypothetical protein